MGSLNIRARHVGCPTNYSKCVAITVAFTVAPHPALSRPSAGTYSSTVSYSKVANYSKAALGCAKRGLVALVRVKSETYTGYSLNLLRSLC